MEEKSNLTISGQAIVMQISVEQDRTDFVPVVIAEREIRDFKKAERTITPLSLLQGTLFPMDKIGGMIRMFFLNWYRSFFVEVPERGRITYRNVLQVNGDGTWSKREGLPNNVGLAIFADKKICHK